MSRHVNGSMRRLGHFRRHWSRSLFASLRFGGEECFVSHSERMACIDEVTEHCDVPAVGPLRRRPGGGLNRPQFAQYLTENMFCSMWSDGGEEKGLRLDETQQKVTIHFGAGCNLPILVSGILVLEETCFQCFLLNEKWK